MKETLVDIFPGMDGPGLSLTPEDIRGRIAWNLWTGDSYLMWDYLAQHGFGTCDLLKTIDSCGRSSRFERIGIINQQHGVSRALLSIRSSFAVLARAKRSDAMTVSSHFLASARIVSLAFSAIM
jgi:hypothetical protein